MRILSLLALFLVLALSVWVPTRNDASALEKLVLGEAVRIEKAENLPPARLTVAIGARLIGIYNALAGALPGFQVRPQEKVNLNPEFGAMDAAGRNSLQTPYFRALRSFSMMVLQRYAVLISACLMLMPFGFVMLVDGVVHRRIRAAKMQAPRPSLWRAAVLGEGGLFLLSLALPMIPAVPVESLVAIPLVGSVLLRYSVIYWHRFI